MKMKKKLFKNTEQVLLKSLHRQMNDDLEKLKQFNEILSKIAKDIKDKYKNTIYYM